MKKIVIIGSGIGGLSAGASLAHAGYDVTVVEKHFQAGGYATNFKRKGLDGKLITCDVSLHGIGNLREGRYLYKQLDEIGVFEHIKFAGAWTQPGGGYEGTLVSGFTCSRLIQKAVNRKVPVQADKPGMNSDLFMAGMINELNKDYAKNLEVRYHFYFKDVDKHYQVYIHKGKAVLLKDVSGCDVEICCDYTTWYAIGTGALDGEVAFNQGKLKVKGDIALFMHVPKLFSTDFFDDAAVKEERLFKGEILIPLTLAPWILFWSADRFISPIFIGTFAILWTLLIQNVIKPKYARSCTLLESTTIFAFCIYNA